MNKRGQIALFVIVGILIVGAVALFVMFQSGAVKAPVSAEEAEKIVAAQTQPLKDLQDKCVKEVSLKGFNKIGMQAGYYDYSPLQTMDFAGKKVIVVFKDGGIFTNKLPSIKSIEGEFDKYMQAEGYAGLDNCTKEFKSFKKTLDAVEQDKTNRSIKAEIRDDDILIKVEWPLTLRRAEASTLISADDVTLLIPGIIFKTAADIANMEVKGVEFSGGNYDSYMFVNSEKTKHLGIDIRNPGTGTSVLLSTVPYRKDEIPYYFYFAVTR